MRVLIPTCNQRDAERIAEYRRAGRTYAFIAKKMGKGVTAVTRYHRNYENHGLEAFARNFGR